VDTQPSYIALTFALENLITSALRLDDEGLQLLAEKLRQAGDKVTDELRRRQKVAPL
jgi:hypothetical protein